MPRRSFALRSSLALLIPLLLAAPAAAADPPACGPAQNGIVACLAGRLCGCGFERPGRMTGAREGWRWDCGILRPACGGGPDTPAMTGDYPHVLAPALGIELGYPAPRPRPERDRPSTRWAQTETPRKGGLPQRVMRCISWFSGGDPRPGAGAGERSEEAMRTLAWACVGVMLAGSAAAQTSTIDPDRSWQRRQADTIERRAVTDPAGAAREAREQRRLLEVGTRGAIDADAVTTGKRLERAASGQGRIARSQPPRPARAPEPLPFSADTSRDRELFDAERDPLATADLLLERAAEGIAEGRTDGARSDLSLAAAELQMAGGQADPGRLERARRRLGELEARLPSPR